MPRVDAHHHVWDLQVRPQPWTEDLPALQRSFGIDELRPSLARHGIDATIVVQTVAVAAETPELLALAASDPDVAGVVGWTDLTAPGVADRLAELAAPELVGIRHLVQDEPDPSWLTRPEVQAGLAAVGAAGLAYDLLVTPAQLPAAIETVRRQPGVRFVLDHGAKPPIRDAILEPWSRLIADLAAAPNVAVKLSGLVTEAPAHPGSADLRPYCDRLLSAFGPDRVMFGSDWPVCLLACDYDRTVELAESACTGLSAAEKANVFGGTAVRWYAIDQVEM
ncbi:MAG TPA: amidohydrolase family protein [Streptosporangiaceae bacterium]|nr:amidohydrolase family protein [Streptosporangiaceae bacterium]